MRRLEHATKSLCGNLSVLGEILDCDDWILPAKTCRTTVNVTAPLELTEAVHLIWDHSLPLVHSILITSHWFQGQKEQVNSGIAFEMNVTLA